MATKSVEVVEVEAREDCVVLTAGDVEAIMGVREAVALSFALMANAEAVDKDAVEVAVAAELAAAQQVATEAEVVDVCEFGHPIAGDCTTCDAPCCDTDHCESHCDHV